MIAKLRGTVDQIGDGFAVVDVGGVGYRVACAAGTLGRLRAGQTVSLHVETQVGDDYIRLFGFLEEAELNWFRLLTTVQGVGAKTALAILSALRPDEIARAIAAADKTALSRAPGVGGKLAARIAAELRDKVGALALGAAARVSGAAGTVAGVGLEGPVADAVSALANLGYAPADALGAVARAAETQGAKISVEELIRAGLAELSGARTLAAGGRGR
ncbi:MAG: Holliday junction branch migration protein RuvA [Rhodospirillales bacterium]|nr:Holliday junction branch migration protein RuvA [Rhodospirillales bacterium]MSP79503.1 Holliday junction branch migration protein RuvA [Rhodospirillales bacterium]